MTSPLRAVSYLVVIAALAGCGFHLRGSGPGGGVQLGDIALVAQSSDADELIEPLREAITAAGGVIVDAPATTDTIRRVELLGLSSNRRVLTVSSTGKADEYELHYAARFRVAQRDELQPVQSVQTLRSYRFDDTAVLGMHEEEALLRAEMRRELANRIVDRLRLRAR